MGGSGVPHVAELRNGVWYCDCCDGPMEETLGVKVVAWFDMQTVKERITKQMIKIENTEVIGWEAAIRGMRNPMNSWEKSDSYDLGVDPISENIEHVKNTYQIGPNDLSLMMRLRNAGTDHRKFMRMIIVYADITAPLYWWKEFDTYKVGTVADSCSTMHTMANKEFTLDDFSCEHLMDELDFERTFKTYLETTIEGLNEARDKYLETNDKFYWWQMIQLLPSSYNQRRTVMLNYEVLANIYKSRKNHKLGEWCEHDGDDGDGFAIEKKYFGLCDWICDLPYSELITGENTLYDKKGTEASSLSTEN